MKKIKILLINLILLILIILSYSHKVFANDSINIETTLENLKSLGRENFEKNLRNTFPEFFENGIYFNQGYNYFLFENTCGQSISASALNILFHTNYYSENMLVDLSVNNNLCDVKYFEEKKRGSQYSDQLVSTINQISNKNKDKVNCKILKKEDFLSVEEINVFLKNKGLIVLNISSSILWDNKDIEEKIDHYILLTKTNIENGKIKGFYIVDSSGSNINYIDINKYKDILYGYNNELPDGEMILIEKEKINLFYFDKNLIENIIFRRCVENIKKERVNLSFSLYKLLKR